MTDTSRGAHAAADRDALAPDRQHQIVVELGEVASQQCPDRIVGRQVFAVKRASARASARRRHEIEDRPFSLFVTPFHATTDETKWDVTVGETITSCTYKADGVEFEGAADYGQFNVHGGVTHIRL